MRNCLEYLQQQVDVERVYFLGDAVGYLPAYSEVVNLLEESSAICLMGNHDAMLLDRLPLDSTRDESYRICLNRKSLSHDQTSVLGRWPERLEIEIENRSLLLVHGSPWEPLTEYIYPNADLNRFAALEYDAVLMGHTHRPFVSSAGSTHVINVGSCGLPRDAGGLAACAIYDSAENAFQILRIRMNVEEICDRFQNQIHPSVRDCLHRPARAELVGEIVE